jgi:hypothetical protein
MSSVVSRQDPERTYGVVVVIVAIEARNARSTSGNSAEVD